MQDDTVVIWRDLRCGRSKARGTSVKELPANAGDKRDSVLILGWRRSPGAGNGNAVQYFCLESPLDRESLAGYSPWGRKESDTTEH